MTNKADEIRKFRASTGYGLREALDIITKYETAEKALAAINRPVSDQDPLTRHMTRAEGWHNIAAVYRHALQKLQSNLKYGNSCPEEQAALIEEALSEGERLKSELL